jgi:hypothetical protein
MMRVNACRRGWTTRRADDLVMNAEVTGLSREQERVGRVEEGGITLGFPNCRGLRLADGRDGGVPAVTLRRALADM